MRTRAFVELNSLNKTIAKHVRLLNERKLTLSNIINSLLQNIIFKKISNNIFKIIWVMCRKIPTVVK